MTLATFPIWNSDFDVSRYSSKCRTRTPDSVNIIPGSTNVVSQPVEATAEPDETNPKPEPQCTSTENLELVAGNNHASEEVPQKVTNTFPMWDSSFDPTKYSSKSAASTNNTTKTHPRPESTTSANSKVAIANQGTASVPDTNQSQDTAAQISHRKHEREAGIIEQPNEKDVQCTEQLTEVTETRENNETLRLVSLRTIKKIHHTRVEDRLLSLAEVDGWTCVVPHRGFREGQLVLYLQIDSFIPASDDRYGKPAHLQMIDGKLGHRVRTRKFGSGENKIVTQGSVYALEKFSDISDEIRTVKMMLQMGPKQFSDEMMNTMTLAMYRNHNWAEQLGIRKWEEQRVDTNQNAHTKLGDIPTRLFKKTDITRLEDCPNLFIKAKYNKYEYQESVKMDGTSMTVYFVNNRSRRLVADLNPLPEEVGPNTVLQNGRFGVCSKNIDLNELNDCQYGFWKTALRHDLPAKLSKQGLSVAIQGELCGPGINQNREKICDGQPEFFVFSIYDMSTKKYMNPRVVVNIASSLDLKHVPVLGYVKIREIAASHHELKKRVMQRKGEGLIYKCVQDGRAFKVISSTYLLEHGL